MWNALSQSLLQSPFVNKGRVQASTLEALYLRGRAVRAIAEGRIVAFGALWPTASPAWNEIGTLFVDPAKSGNGLLCAGMRELLKIQLPSEDVHTSSYFLITRDEKVMQKARLLGFVEADRSAPFLAEWAAYLGISERIPPLYRADPNAKDDGRRLFIKTAGA